MKRFFTIATSCVVALFMFDLFIYLNEQQKDKALVAMLTGSSSTGTFTKEEPIVSVSKLSIASVMSSMSNDNDIIDVYDEDVNPLRVDKNSNQFNHLNIESNEFGIAVNSLNKKSSVYTQAFIRYKIDGELFYDKVDYGTSPNLKDYASYKYSIDLTNYLDKLSIGSVDELAKDNSYLEIRSAYSKKELELNFNIRVDKFYLVQ